MRQPERARGGGTTSRRYWLAGLPVLVAAVPLGLVWRARTGGPPATLGAGGPVPLRETRPTLDPARFVGRARATHEIARAEPGLLDQLYCYCACDKSIGHKSLLSCYTDGHAAT